VLDVHSKKKLGSSFRDSSGFVFKQGENILRQVSSSYERDYCFLNDSGLYNKLATEEQLVTHEVVQDFKGEGSDKHAIIKPERISFISYPYEWSFSQLKDAALLTLNIQKTALLHGMVLKDASAFNIQFLRGRPVLIDTLSFVIYREGDPWIAYRQFCQQFLAPLYLMSMSDVRLGSIQSSFINGIPLDLVCRMLPTTARFKVRLLMHIYIHARLQRTYGYKRTVGRNQMSKEALIMLVSSLRKSVEKCEWRPQPTEWGNYYKNTNYAENSIVQKGDIVRRLMDKINYRMETVWDVGANNGFFSRIVSGKGINTIAIDIDPLAVEKNYLQVKKEKNKYLLPLVVDVTNPTPALGWANEERASLLGRGPADLVLALALIHHLAITNNLSLDMIAAQLGRMGKYLIIEWVPKQDSNVRKMLNNREDIFHNYTQDGFEKSFTRHFFIMDRVEVVGTCRCIYLMCAKDPQARR